MKAIRDLNLVIGVPKGGDSVEYITKNDIDAIIHPTDDSDDSDNDDNVE